VIFNSLAFAVFLLAALTIHYLPLPWPIRKVNLTLLGYLFYASWYPPTIVLLWIGTLFDWSMGRMLEHSKNELRRRLMVFGSVVLNVGFLAYFKYIGFLIENVNHLLAQASINFSLNPRSPALPVGISFYTFMSLSYVIDVYRGKTRAVKSLPDFALFLSFFPHLVAGPIIRAHDFVPQLATPKSFSWDRISWGMCLLALGLFEKVVVADGLLAPIADKVFAAPAELHGGDTVVGVLAFSGQILCDFAGYSTCAVGVAASLGFRLPENFYAPYSARGFSDFWRRWHVSLSSWLRDYLYISLGGNRASPARTQVNLLLTMLIGGLWHGPSWTFVVWGGLHGFYLIIERGLRAARIGAAWPPALAGMAAWGITQAGVILAWVFFRAADFTTAFHLVRKLIGSPVDRSLGVVGLGEAIIAVAAVAGVYLAQQAFRHRTFERQADLMGRPALAAVIAVLILAIATSSGNDRAFIYFQF